MLREGLTNYDSITDLWKRLESIPTDLEQFFKQILSSVEPFYHAKMAGTLQITLAARSPLPLEVYSFHDLEYADDNYALNRPVHPMCDQEILDFHGPTSRRLNGWCKGFLETRNNHVVFIHRTVYDFLKTRDMAEFLEEKNLDAFSPVVSMMKAYIAWTKSTEFPSTGLWRYPERWTRSTIQSRTHPIQKRMQTTFEYAKIIQNEGSPSRALCERLLDELENSIVMVFNMGQLVDTTMCSPMNLARIRSFFRELLMEYDLGDYLPAKMLHNADYFTDFDRAPLWVVLEAYTENMLIYLGDEKHGSDDLPECRRILCCLLEHSHSPNQLLTSNSLFTSNYSYKRTPWAEFMSCVLSLSEGFPWDDLPLKSEHTNLFIHILKTGIFSLLLGYEADPNTPILRKSSNDNRFQCPPCWIVWLFLVFDAPDICLHSDHYLRDLKTMLSSSISVPAMIIPFLAMHGRKAQSTKSLWEMFCDRLDTMSLTLDMKMQNFLAQVIIELAKFAGNFLAWDPVIPTLQRLILPNQFRQLLQVLGKPENVPSVGIRERDKRAREDSEYLEVTKRRRSM